MWFTTEQACHAIFLWVEFEETVTSRASGVSVNVEHVFAECFGQTRFNLAMSARAEKLATGRI
jgi:hypothetical protein